MVITLSLDLTPVKLYDLPCNSESKSGSPRLAGTGIVRPEKLLKNIAVSFAMSLDSINSNIEFTSKISLNSDNYTGDKIKFEEVILNLLQNAKDAVSEKTFTDSKGSIFLCAEKISDSIVISCTDNGCGISDDIVNTIFDPFVTYKTNGTGLGLALSKKIIEAHGGTLIVTSSDETGTVFTITLPV